MARKEITQTAQVSDRKLRTRGLIYAGAFGAIYIVLMLIVVLGTSAIPILYIVAPFTVASSAQPSMNSASSKSANSAPR